MLDIFYDMIDYNKNIEVFVKFITHTLQQKLYN
jgi:hypothetical protein